MITSNSEKNHETWLVCDNCGYEWDAHLTLSFACPKCGCHESTEAFK